jgi:hypothetical protein
MAYRSPRQTLEQQRVRLEAERRELDDAIRRVEGLRRRRAEVADQLRNVEESLDEVADQHHLAGFARTTVASPFYRRADDSVLTSDCPKGARARSHRRLAIAAAVTLAAGAACASEIESHTEAVVMAKVSEITEL